MATLLTTKQAAEKLGVNDRRVTALIRAGRLPAQKVGRDWLINPKDLAKVQDRRPGRPKGKK
jgi:excisionase family DNA binding protein